MVGSNPIVLVGTKMDLLPAGARPKDVAEWLAESAARRRLQVRPQVLAMHGCGATSCWWRCLAMHSCGNTSCWGCCCASCVMMCLPGKYSVQQACVKSQDGE
jgi:hypothetical protein